MNLNFVWDEDKHKRNLEKHGISLEEAESVWFDPLALEYDDVLHSVDEERFIRIGFSFSERILLIVFTIRSEDQAIRLISARKATAKERDTYEKGI